MLGAVVMVIVAGASVAADVAAGGGSTTTSKASGAQKGAIIPGINFVSECKFVHFLPDDPIVYPGQPGKSHDHTFVGNTSTNAYSTLATLQAAGTTCQRPNDKAGYWMPTLIVDGQPVTPLGATIYYRRDTRARLQAFPSGLEMIAGDSKATSPQSLQITYWNCGVLGGVKPSTTPPACPSGKGQGLRLHVNFPSCWDGKNLDSADHKSHMAYPTGRACPADHPVAVPAISLIYRYPISGDHDFALSSGGVYSAHADFFNAWNENALTHLVNFCLNGLRHCGRGI
ncbi:MAG TPA: DUF1996 domain-containing protein [Gaiellaceae bacterium]|nr:DUF1996 domain-containing protein [Gaiellaceae bacterium]